jgi:hypothetical protein
MRTWTKVALGLLLLASAVAAPPMARLLLEIPPQRIVSCEVVYRHHPYANVQLEGGRLLSLEPGDVGMPVVCPPVSSLLSKQRWEWDYSIKQVEPHE